MNIFSANKYLSDPRFYSLSYHRFYFYVLLFSAQAIKNFSTNKPFDYCFRFYSCFLSILSSLFLSSLAYKSLFLSLFLSLFNKTTLVIYPS